MRQSILLYALALFAAFALAADDAPPFNKEELEALLKKEHSQRVSNIYDNENGIQCVSATLPWTPSPCRRAGSPACSCFF